MVLLYDSSFLMADEKNYNWCLFNEKAIYRLEYMDIRHCVPVEVQLELSRHIKNIDDPKKNQLARTARARYAALLASPEFMEASLENVAIPIIHESILGPDSDVDKKLIGFAYNLISEKIADVVVILTRDAGIGAEIAYQVKTNNRPVFCPLVKGACSKFIVGLTQPDYDADPEAQERKRREEERARENAKRREEEELKEEQWQAEREQQRAEREQREPKQQDGEAISRANAELSKFLEPYGLTIPFKGSSWDIAVKGLQVFYERNRTCTNCYETNGTWKDTCLRCHNGTMEKNPKSIWKIVNDCAPKKSDTSQEK